MGQAPCNNGKSLRTFNRNFYGRSGTKSADVYLVSPETAVASALAGVITDPSGIEVFAEAKVPEKFEIAKKIESSPSSASRFKICREPGEITKEIFSCYHVYLPQ